MLLELSKACFGKIKNNDLNCFLGFGDPSLEAQHQSSLGPIDALFGVLTGHAVPIVLHPCQGFQTHFCFIWLVPHYSCKFENEHHQFLHVSIAKTKHTWNKIPSF